ncbi:1215_t:CDS:2 [Dentiscutata heterogama]|uniref:1215_t:CDS:1 n=1 Tax=Dentiscutata heterogama TaxID=1316150 RepID=A0ACA9L7C3_9GLOM|nr:1215_t:CDS:2 [Dentiscutata heterogama]
MPRNIQLTDFEKGQIIGIIINLPLHEILSSNDINISQATARNILHKHGIWGRIATKKPGLTQRQAEAQLAWCNACVNWSVNDWQKIIFNDE